MLGTSQAGAGTIAVFGDNELDNFINGSTVHTATLVSDAQLATAGFLSGFDAFLYTRDGASLGASLSAAAAANVQSFVTGSIVLFNGDWADPFLGNAGGEPSANVIQLWKNALDLVVAGGGYIGEFGGAVAAFSMGLVDGVAGGQNCCAGDGLVSAAIPGHPVLAGVTLPFNPGDVEFAAPISGVDPSLIVATYANGNAAIIVAHAGNDVPEPAALGLLALGLAALRGRRKQARA